MKFIATLEKNLAKSSAGEDAHTSLQYYRHTALEKVAYAPCKFTPALPITTKREVTNEMSINKERNRLQCKKYR